MSLCGENAITRARVVRQRLATLRAHQTAGRQRLHAIVVKELLAAGYSTSQAGRILGLSRTFVHRVAQDDTEPPDQCPEFDAIDEAVERYVLG